MPRAAKSDMRTAEQISALVTAAEGWRGTPFVANSRVRGRGVSCQTLVVSVLLDAGWITTPFEIPSAPMSWGRVSNDSRVEAWFAGPGLEIFDTVVPVDATEPGDILGFRVGCCVHHVGLWLPGGQVVHAMPGTGADIIPGLPDSWRKRWAKSWRLKA